MNTLVDMGKQRENGAYYTDKLDMNILKAGAQVLRVSPQSAPCGPVERGYVFVPAPGSQSSPQRTK